MFCHFRISVAGSPPETVAFRLRPDKCPKTCDNFAALCRSPGTARRPRSSLATSAPSTDQQPGTYRGTEFHRILPGFMVQGGDFTNFDGTGGRAAHATNGGRATFPDENFDIPHDREGVLSMANRGRDTNGSQFFVTLGRAPHLDGKHVAFGHVVRGMEAVREASRVETEGDNGRPAMMQRVVIVDCGIGTGDVDGGSPGSDGGRSFSSESYSVDSIRRRGKSRKKKRRHGDRHDDRHSSRRKKKKRSSRDDHKRRKHRNKSSDDSSSTEDERRARSSKKRRKKDRRSDDDRHHPKKRREGR